MYSFLPDFWGRISLIHNFESRRLNRGGGGFDMVNGGRADHHVSNSLLDTRDSRSLKLYGERIDSRQNS